ncbi:MAG: GGDEF domain-containing protein [Eubacteriales bacterium]|nr:GGDEF domain-containing protein [Eubacteriales bacterium]
MAELLRKTAKEERLPSSLELFITRLNMKRSLLVCGFALLLQVTNLFGEHLRQYSYMRIGCIITVSLVLVYGVLILTVFNRKGVPLRYLTRISTGFWIVFALQMSPYFWSDVLYSQTPVNMLIFAATLSICPVFKKKTIWTLYPALLLYMLLNIAIVKAPIDLFMTGVSISVVCVVLATTLQTSFYRIVEDLYMQCETDGLTQIYNRKAGTARMESLLTLCKRMEHNVAVFFIDIDHFKNYNDTYGHLKGDEALSAVSECVQATFSRETDVVCRIGGEEFAVMACISHTEDAVHLAQQLSERVAALHIKTGDGAAFMYTSVSIGLALFGGHAYAANEETVTSFINAADEQLYHAKRNGRNCISFENKIIPGAEIERRADER